MARVRDELEELMVGGCDVGQLEALLEKRLRELGRPLLEEAVQKLADRQPLSCPRCGGPLHIERHRRLRRVLSVFGKVPFVRSYGFCPPCGERFYPADVAMGLQERAPASPRVQEICALMVLESPAAQAEANIRRLTGLDLGQASMHREARRQGERALRLRDADAALTNTVKGIRELACRATAPRRDFTLVIEIDAWNIRERDHWGESRKMRAKGEEPTRWHWVYAGTIFRLDQRGKTASGRSVITEWTVAHDLYGQTPQARQWVLPMLGWLKRRKNGALDVINALHEIRADLEKLSTRQQETLDREIRYFENHKDRMDYKSGKALDQPIGSGAIESTCSQYQCRFKRTGQFWSLDGDEAFLALETLHRNGRWHRLFPHDQQKE